MKTSKNRKKRKRRKNRHLRRTGGPHLPPHGYPLGAPPPPRASPFMEATDASRLVCVVVVSYDVSKEYSPHTPRPAPPRTNSHTPQAHIQESRQTRLLPSKEKNFVQKKRKAYYFSAASGRVKVSSTGSDLDTLLPSKCLFHRNAIRIHYVTARGTDAAKTVNAHHSTRSSAGERDFSNTKQL